MGAYGYYAGLAYDVLEQFLRDWHRDPFVYDTEHDIQSELYARLTTAFRLVGCGRVKAHYPDFEFIKGPQRWNRVTCEPTLLLPVTKDEFRRVNPDIVVWDDPKHSDSPPSEEEGDPFPIAWVCEIKMDRRWSTGPVTESELWAYVRDRSGRDLEKLELLVGKLEVQHACTLFLQRGISATQKHSVFWSRNMGMKTAGGLTEAAGRSGLWHCASLLPAKLGNFKR